jgi:uncharacterized membrane protein
LIYGNLRRLVSSPSPASPRRDLVFREERGGFSLTLKRNCSISPAGLLRVYGGLSVLVLAIAAVLAAAGAPLVLPFAGLEVIGLGVAFLLYARSAADYERIEIAGGRLTVEVAEAWRTSRYQLDAGRTRICLEKARGYGARVVLRAGEQELEVGRYLDADARVEFAVELGRRLAS